MGWAEMGCIDPFTNSNGSHGILLWAPSLTNPKDKFWIKIGHFLKNNYKYRLKPKIMPKLVRLGHVCIHISNAAFIGYNIEIVF